MILFQWRGVHKACPYGNGGGSNSTTGSCHDAVDLPLCFEDTAILYGITAAFLVLAGFTFVCGNGLKARLSVGLLHSIKMVSYQNNNMTIFCRALFELLLYRQTSCTMYNVYLYGDGNTNLC